MHKSFIVSRLLNLFNWSTTTLYKTSV